MSDEPATAEYQVGDPDPVSAVYRSTEKPAWAACLHRDPSDWVGTRVCQWPLGHPHAQHVAVAGYRITSVWPNIEEPA